MVKGAPESLLPAFRGFYFIKAQFDKGGANMKAKTKGAKSAAIIAHRRKCKSSSGGTGLSHYILMNGKKQKRSK